MSLTTKHYISFAGIALVTFVISGLIMILLLVGVGLVTPVKADGVAQRVAALEAKVANLEARIVELEKKLSGDRTKAPAPVDDPTKYEGKPPIN